MVNVDVDPLTTSLEDIIKSNKKLTKRTGGRSNRPVKNTNAKKTVTNSVIAKSKLNKAKRTLSILNKAKMTANKAVKVAARFANAKRPAVQTPTRVRNMNAASKNMAGGQLARVARMSGGLSTRMLRQRRNQRSDQVAGKARTRQNLAGPRSRPIQQNRRRSDVAMGRRDRPRQPNLEQQYLAQARALIHARGNSNRSRPSDSRRNDDRRADRDRGLSRNRQQQNRDTRRQPNRRYEDDRNRRRDNNNNTSRRWNQHDDRGQRSYHY